MGGILLKRLVNSGVVQSSEIIACDTDADRLRDLAGELDIATSSDNTSAAAATTIILAVPPPAVLPVLSEIAAGLNSDQLVISLAPGISLAQMREIAHEAQLARVMPNTPSLVGAGMNAFCCADGMSAEALTRLLDMLDAWGESIEVPEELMNAACALLAVGPTYLFPIMRALMEAAVSAGLPDADARAITAGLFVGTGRLLAETDNEPDELRDMISIQTLDEAAACEIFADAFQEAFGKLEGLERKLASQ
ncbi:MAG: NAD(P)-binding domain-containing protein [Armatimonadetes bacterium]|nr:NAD(P)-binding domain-containing protein [Armatimonadota bacterium]